MNIITATHLAKIRAVVGVVVLAAVAAAAGARTTWTPVGQGRLEIKTASLQPPKRLFAKKVPAVAPLKHTDVKMKVRGFVAEVTVTQEFHNPVAEPIEAVYVFPLPHDSAVNATEMRIGKRVIRGRIERREKARQQYERARDQGKRASLLEQERPNIFTQSVANIGPRETIHVSIRYVQTLPYKDGSYELVFPMVVGPRYIPGAGKSGRGEMLDGNELAVAAAPPRRQSGHGRIADNPRVPDASRITPPVIPPGQRCGFDIAVTVDVDAGVPIRTVRSRAHKVTVTREGDSKAVVVLDKSDSVPNKDFVLEIATAGKQPEIGLLAHDDGKGGYFTMILQPPEAPAADDVRPREIICVMDTSGSMTGQPIDLAKKAAIKLLQTLRPSDRFNVYRFSNNVSSFRANPVPAEAGNVRSGIRYINSLHADGGTEMLKGVQAALRKPNKEGLLRMIVLLSDGYIGNEREIFEEIQRNVASARFFALGIGSSVNRYLLDRMAVLGRGMADVILLNDKPEDVIDRFARRLARPVLTDLKVVVSGVVVYDCIPADVGDLFAGVPVYMHGRYRASGEARVEVLGRIGTKPCGTKMKVTFPAATKDSSPLGSLWARQRIKQLELEVLGMRQGSLESEITEIALAASLMSRYTSFVAIDESEPTWGGRPKVVPVSVPMPEGVSYETTLQNSNIQTGGSPMGGGGGGFSFRFGGPVGTVALVMAGALGLAELRRRRKEKRRSCAR